MGAFSGLNSGTGAHSGLNSGTGALSGLNSGTGALSGFNTGTGALSASQSMSPSITSPLQSSCPRSIISSPSATVQGAELLSALSLSAAFSLVAGSVAGSHTACSSGYAAIRCSVAPCSDGSSVAAGDGSPSAVGSGSGEMVGWALGPVWHSSVHSTKAAKLARGPSSDDGALYTEFRLAS